MSTSEGISSSLSSSSSSSELTPISISSLFFCCFKDFRFSRLLASCCSQGVSAFFSETFFWTNFSAFSCRPTSQLNSNSISPFFFFSVSSVLVISASRFLYLAIRSFSVAPSSSLDDSNFFSGCSASDSSSDEMAT